MERLWVPSCPAWRNLAGLLGLNTREEINVEVFPADHKKADGILIPFAVTQKLLGRALS